MSEYGRSIPEGVAYPCIGEIRVNGVEKFSFIKESVAVDRVDATDGSLSRTHIPVLRSGTFDVQRAINNLTKGK